MPLLAGINLDGGGSLACGEARPARSLGGGSGGACHELLACDELLACGGARRSRGALASVFGSCAGLCGIDFAAMLAEPAAGLGVRVDAWQNLAAKGENEPTRLRYKKNRRAFRPEAGQIISTSLFVLSPEIIT